jgi:hypothetical protein
MTLVTTLLDAAVYPVAELAALYRQRWRVETSRAHLKTTMQMDVLHGKTVPGVLKELTVLAIVDTLVRRVICQSAALQHVGVGRISVLAALRWLSAPSTGIPLGALIVNPARPQRVEPRVKTRRPKSCPLMIRPRPERRQPLVQQECKGSLQAIRVRPRNAREHPAPCVDITRFGVPSAFAVLLGLSLA